MNVKTGFIAVAMCNTAKEHQIHSVFNVSWKTWKTRYPDTLILDINTGYTRDYEKASPFFDQQPGVGDDSEPVDNPQLQDPTQDYPGNPLVCGLYLDGRAKAFTINSLREKGIVNDKLGGVNFVLLYENSGDAFYAFRRDSEVFADAGKFELKDQNGTTWQIQEAELSATDSDKTLKRIHSQVALLNAWLAWYPDSEFNYE